MGRGKGGRRGRRLALIGIPVFVCAGVASAALARGAGASDAPPPSSAVQVVTVLDAPPPDAPPPDAPPPVASAAAAGSASAPIVAVIPPRTFVHVDEGGRVVEAMTNTGRPPAADDQFFIADNGPNRPLDAATAAAVVHRAAGQDWSHLGRYQRLP